MNSELFSIIKFEVNGQCSEPIVGLDFGNGDEIDVAALEESTIEFPKSLAEL